MSEHCVHIYPKGKDSDLTVKVKFDSKSEKEDYVKKEFWFCRDEYDKWHLARGVKSIRQSYDNFLAKRVSFAKKMGYKPLKHDINTWVKKNETQTPNSIA